MERKPFPGVSNSCDSMSSQNRGALREFSRKWTAKRRLNPAISLPSVSKILRGPASLGFFSSKIVGRRSARKKIAAVIVSRAKV